MANIDYRDGFLVQNASTTQGPFVLLGGKYGVSCAVTGTAGSVALQILGADGVTFVTVAPAFTANGAVVVDLPAGKCQVAITTATGVFVSVIPISYRK
jgi:hypothetical protein